MKEFYQINIKTHRLTYMIYIGYDAIVEQEIP